MKPGPAAAAVRVHRAICQLWQRASDAGSTAVASDLDKMRSAADQLRGQLKQLPQHLAETTDVDGRNKLRHDLRTPVNQVLGYCELVAEETEDAGDTRWLAALEAIESDTRALLRQIDQVGMTIVRDSDAPVPRPPPSGGWAALSRPHPAATSEGPSGTILVVDDNRQNRELLERRLRRDGFAVETAEHGVQALVLARTRRVDVVLLDIMMPVMDGYQTLEQLKGDASLRHLPVIMLSSLDEPQSISRCIERGAEDHLPKPFDPVLLRARIGASLDRKRVRDLERAYLDRIVAEKRRADDLLHGVIPIGVALSAERDLGRLLQRVLEEARRFCGADGGVLFLRKDDQLERVLLQCDSVDLSDTNPEDEGAPQAFDLHGDEGHRRPAAEAAAGRTITLDDTRGASPLDMSDARAFDRRHGYVTRSLLALPLRAVDGEVVGVLELWNATRASDGEAVPFDRAMIDVLQSLSSLAGAALASYRRETDLRQRIRHLEIRVDEANRRRDVSQITETDYFRKLRDMAREIRATTTPSTDG
ncbi:MAG: response regulator [Deltaproteobacteria bacterium]|nr:response regulator [Deltaproteobacteria bacterium]